ncbi:DUF485 domain-containing protein [Sphingopyxis sp. PET50]|uniref:DUF485 domain-containing protein n=1 Tax=Sphingopyxis sp. PET50 TaxID=2976533 RepID=UPI0021AEF3F4|nr:DUF485 domain-containing protein [Sphingopyxis sp. PET50]
MEKRREGEPTETPGPQPIEADERYRRLVAGRSRFAWTLTCVMLAIYFGYILLIAFEPEMLARPLGSGVTSLGIPLGIGVILAGILLTAVYVRRANKVFDRDLDALRKDYGA